MQSDLTFLFILGIGIIALGCLTPKHWFPTLPNDKLLHFLAFGGLTLLAGRIAATWVELVAWLLGLLAVGALIEGLQILIPGRNFCWRDIAANAAGIATAATCSKVVLGI
ncbi:MAG: VanZ family protein [Burkholderiaceae bacterium]|nr:VanZ family protein [Burkholderiaceae bacterium]